jgi:alpha-galactosidase
MSRKDVQDYIIEAVSSVLRSANIEYVKWDMNRNMTEHFSALQTPDRQRETQHRYMLGLYRVMEEIISAFPHVLFESCSGGGGRFDAGLLYYMPQTWTSDDTDAVERLGIQYGTSFAYPASAMGAHVSAVPNHQTGRITSMKMRGDVALGGNFGFELDLSTLSDEDRETVRIPNEEIRIEYAESVHEVTHIETIQRVKRSVQLMKDTIDMNADAVAAELQKVHTEEYHPRHYNNEQSLRGTIKLAFFAYKDEYLQLEELAGGTGYADIVYLPKRNSDYPALVVELKAFDKNHPQNDAEGAIAQIKNRQYPEILDNYIDEILLVGISYDKDDPDKKHTCVIESWQQ